VRDITLSARSHPRCSHCSSEDLTVVQHIQQSSKALRVDGLGDIEVEPPDPLLRKQSIVIRCNACGVEQVPALGVEAYALSGFEDSFNFPERISNDEHLDLW
jgi:hypothetical protein